MKALLFDLDGTLADTDRLHERAWLESLAPHGVAGDHHFYQTQISGGLNPEIAARLLPHLSEAERAALVEAKEARFRELAGALEPLPGLRGLWGWAEAHGLRRALVSNAPRVNAEHLLAMFGLRFDLLVLSEELPLGKPDPLPYRTALERLGIGADQAVAFEDSPSGVRSGAGAGVRVVGLATGHPPDALRAAGALMVVPDFRDRRLLRWLVAQLGLDEGDPGGAL